jgi:lysophospholipase L1-like esterase
VQSHAGASKFEFRSEPRNPPLTINFVVYVDYEAEVKDRILTKRSWLKTKPSVVACVGDSIVAGSHTISRLYFDSDADSWCGLLRAYLGDGSNVVNRSVEGGEIGAVRKSLESLVALKPDVVIIEFGMNDHPERVNDFGTPDVMRLVCSRA